MTKKLKLSPAKGEMGTDLFETAAESLLHGKALRVDGNHEGEPFSFMVAKGKKAVAHLDSKLKPKHQHGVQCNDGPCRELERGA